MYRFLFLLVILPFFTVAKAQTNYFVSINGNDNNSGLSENSAWRTITYAMSLSSPVTEGDIVNIKSGNYENENIVIEKSGTIANPIIVNGYQTIPGDNPNLNFTFGDALDASIMPLIDGGDRTTGTGINIDGAANITIKNIQITNYESGIYTWSSSSTNLVLDNIIVKNVGDINDSYSRLGIGIIYANNNIVRNCVVVNSCAEGITIVANNNLVENCKVYCDENMTVNASTDYYITVTGNNNTFTGCYIERVGDLEHIGHGMGVKGACENNLFENCTAKDMEGGGFYVRHRAAMHNEFRNCKAIGTLSDVLGFLVRDGASYNVFNNCFSDGCTSGIRFMDTAEDDGAQYCGRYNTFNNCIITNSIWAIEYLAYSVPSPADNNIFANCTFYNGTYLFETNRENYANQMTNCIVSNFQTLNTGTEPLNFDFLYSNFYNNGFSAPQGTGNISINPLFEDATLNNFHLQNGSFCIDVGTNVNAPNFDYDNTPRPQGNGFDMGAFENTGASLIDENAIEEFVIFPNQTTGNVYFSEKFSNNHIRIFSISGRFIKTETIINNTIDLSKLKPGIYFMQIVEKPNKITKLIKK